jgi:hypothetical protein
MLLRRQAGVRPQAGGVSRPGSLDGGRLLAQQRPRPRSWARAAAPDNMKQAQPELKDQQPASSVEEPGDDPKKPRAFGISRLYQQLVQALSRAFSPLLGSLSETRRKWIAQSLKFAAISLLVAAASRHALFQRNRTTVQEVRPARPRAAHTHASPSLCPSHP